METDAQPSPEYDLFVSFAETDRAWVEGYLLDALAAAAVRCQSEAAFALGVPRLLEFERAVQRSRRTLLVLSPGYFADGFAQFLDVLAQSVGAADSTWPVIPLVLRPVALPPRLAQLTALDATDPATWPDVVAHLCAELQRPAPGPTPRPACPYPGMVPFTEQDAGLFFGRKDEIDDLLLRLRHQNELFVIGPSGSGKSSLVFAGLLPALHARQPGRWRAIVMRPGGAPLAALARSLGVESLDEGNATVAVAAALAQPAPAEQLLLIVDQLEELYVQTPRPDQAVFLRLLQALRGLPQCAIVLTLRADFYPDLMISDRWPVDAGQRFEIAPLRGAALRDAIDRPAQACGVALEAGLLERLLADAADEPGVLPLIQETMALLWERMQRRLISLALYEELGSADRSGLVVAIANNADATLAALPHQQALARRILLRLIQFGEGRADTRRSQRVDDLRADGDDPQLFEQTLRHLTENRLLTLSGDESDRDRRVDLAHEALIGGWPVLRQWINERRKAEQDRRRLEEKAAEWVRLGRGASGLLDAGELAEAERWLSSPDAAELGTSATLRDLVRTSVAANAEAEQAKEAARQRELAQERAFTQRLRQRAVYLAVALALALAAAGYAFFQRNEAQAQRNIARTAEAQAVAENNLTRTAEARTQAQLDISESQRLGNLAQNQLSDSPETALLLAYESAAHDDNPQSQQVLRDVLAHHTRVISALAGHTGAVTSAVFSPDGQKVLTASNDGTARLWDASGKELATLRGHTDRIISAAFSPDGRTILTASADGTARLWDTSGQPLATLRGHTDAVVSAVFSPDGRNLLTASADGTARLWDTSGQPLATLSGHSGPVTSAVFSPDGRTILTASEDETAQLWDMSGQPLATLSGHTGAVYHALFSPDGRKLLTASQDQTAQLWDVNGQPLAALRGHTGAVFNAVFSPDGQKILTASQDQTARLWDASGVELATLNGHAELVISAAFSPDGQKIVTASADGTARLWDARGKPLATLRGHTDWVTSAAFSPDGQEILTASQDQTARLWDARVEELPALSDHTGAVLSAIFSPDGKIVLTTSADQTARLWDTSGKQLATLRGHIGWVTSAAFSPDGQKIVTASFDAARLWDASGVELATLRGHTGTVTSAAFSPDGQKVLTASQDQTARLWDTSGVELATLHGHTGAIYSAAFSPDGQKILTASQDQTARLWDTSGVELATLRGHSGTVIDAAFSPDGQKIVTTSVDGTARLWDASGAPLVTLSGHSGAVTSAVFSPDGQKLLTASADGTARLWDASGAPLATLRGHTDNIYQAVFSPDGRAILTASADGTARLYLSKTEDLLRVAACRVGRGLTDEEIARFQVPAPPRFDFARRKCPPVFSTS